jgi:D-alanyl-D-alanine-carboxypeptidase/D-alanyl-D-alanine-endopeptidase
MTLNMFDFNESWPIRIAATVAIGVQMLLAVPTRANQASVAGSVASTDIDSAVQQAVAPFMAGSCHVGLSMAVVNGESSGFYNYGSTVRGQSVLPTPDSVYEIASVTKTFTGVLAARAVLERRIELDADFRQYLPQPYPNLTWQGHPITLRTLATHRSGLPRDLPDTDDLYAHPDDEQQPSQLLARDAPYDRRRYLRELHSVQLRHEPGAVEAYSNLGLKVIGWGLEKVYATPYEQLVQRTILAPLGMSSSGFVLTAAESRRLVRGYSRGGNLMPYHLRNAGAAYGLYSTPHDMANYARWQLDESIAVIRLAHQPIYADLASGQALIWNVAMDHGSRMLWHGGGTFGMSSQVVLYPDQHEGYVLLANDTCAGTESALGDIATAVHASFNPIGAAASPATR